MCGYMPCSCSIIMYRGSGVTEYIPKDVHKVIYACACSLLVMFGAQWNPS